MSKMVSDPGGFDFDGVFDDDYVYFYEDERSAEKADRDTELICGLAQISPGDAVLDLGCGYGRIANRLSLKKMDVIGLDRSKRFLELARDDATVKQAAVDYVEGDMRTLEWTNRFDAIVIWFTAFGYFGDEENEKVLRECTRALKPGGRLLIDQVHRSFALANFRPLIVERRGDDMLIDESSFDPTTDRVTTDRTIVRDGRVRKARFFVRLYGFPELRSLLHDAGFSLVEPFGGDGEALELRHGHVIVRATK